MSGRFVQDPDRCILDQQAGKLQPLQLSSAYPQPVRANRCVVSKWQSHDEIVNECLAGCLLDLLSCGTTPRDAKILVDRRVKEMGLS